MKSCRLRSLQKSWKAQSETINYEKAGRETVSLPAFAVRWIQDGAWEGEFIGDRLDGGFVFCWVDIRCSTSSGSMLFAEKHRTTFPYEGKAWRLPDESASFAAGTLGMGSAFPYEGKVPSCARRMRWSFWHKTSLPLCRGRLGGYRMNPLRLQLHAAVRLRCKRRRRAILRRWCRYTASADSRCSAHLPPIRARESRQRRR